MKKNEARIRDMMNRLLKELEEEDVGISLLTTHYQSSDELRFFTPLDREKVAKVLRRLCEDSKQHKKILERLIETLNRKISHEK